MASHLGQQRLRIVQQRLKAGAMNLVAHLEHAIPLAMAALEQLDGAEAEQVMHYGAGAVVQADAAAIRISLMEIATRRALLGGNYPDSDNPMNWLGSPVGHYAGAFDARPAGRSLWYFDNRQRELIYLFDDDRQARFRLARNGMVDAGRGAMGGIGLIRLPDRRE